MAVNLDLSFSRKIVLTFSALFAFAANSILCRLALHEEQVDPADFTSIRLLCAAFILAFIITIKDRSVIANIHQYGSQAGTLFLFVYVVSLCVVSSVLSYFRFVVFCVSSASSS